MGVLTIQTCLLQVLAVSLVLDIVLCSPVKTGVSAEDMVNNGQLHYNDLDSKAMQALLKKLWRYEAETWKAKFEDVEVKGEVLAQRVQQLQRALEMCQAVTAGSDEGQHDMEGTWHDVVTSDVVTETADDQNVEEDLRALTNQKQDTGSEHGELYDTSFVILPLEERSMADDDDSYIRITSPQDDDVSVRVTEPRDAQEVTYRIPPHGVIQIPLNRVPRGDSSSIQLQSDQPVRVQVLTGGGNSPAEGYNVIFVSSLGAHYRLTEEDARFAIVAISNDTEVTVADSSGKSLYSVVLEQGQTFVSPAGSGPDFTGGDIEASKDVAVFTVRPTQCDNQGCSGRTLQLLQPKKLEKKKAWNDCLISSSGCKKKRPRPG